MKEFLPPQAHAKNWGKYLESQYFREYIGPKNIETMKSFPLCLFSAERPADKEHTFFFSAESEEEKEANIKHISKITKIKVSFIIFNWDWVVLEFDGFEAWFLNMFVIFSWMEMI